MKKLAAYALGAFFLVGGLNHFINPHFYLPLIPDYLPFPEFLNFVSGFLEIVAGLAIMIPKYRKLGAWLVIVLMVLFIPSHVYFIQIGSCVEAGLCVPEWVAWLRLLLIHPLLIYWAWIVKNL